MPYSSRLFSFAFLLFLGSTLLFPAGCGDDPSSPGSGSTVAPKIGSTYTIAGYNTSADGTIIESTRDTVTYTLAEIHSEFRGEKNVYEFSSKFGPGFIAYHDNGDVSVLFRASFSGTTDSVWLRLPFAGEESINATVFEDVQNAGPARVENRMIYTADRTGSTTVTVAGGETLGAEKIVGKLESKITYIISGQTENEQIIDNNLEFWFAPQIGYLVYQKSSITQQGASIGAGSYAELISYHLK